MDADSPLVQAALKTHAGNLGLEVVEFTGEGEVWLCPRPDADPRVKNAAAAAKAALGEKGRVGPREVFLMSDPAGAHAARIAARAVAVASLQRSRLDAEGVEAIDIEAQSHPKWTS